MVSKLLLVLAIALNLTSFVLASPQLPVCATTTSVKTTTATVTAQGTTVTKTVTATAAAASPTAPMGAEVIQSNIKAVTEKSRALQIPANKIVTADGLLILVGQGNFPIIIAGFYDIVTFVNGAMGMKMMKITSSKDCDLIFDAFREFVYVHQELLKILFGKAGLLRLVPALGEPVANVLVAIENVVDNLALALINNLQYRADDTKGEQGKLDQSLKDTQQRYRGAAQVGGV